MLSSSSTTTTPTDTHGVSTTLVESSRSSSSPPSLTSPSKPTPTNTSSSSSRPAAKSQNDIKSQSQRTGCIVGGVIGTFVILVLLLLFHFRFCHSIQSIISQWLGYLPGASDVSRTSHRLIDRARPHGHRGSLTTRRRWYGISVGSRPRDSILPFTRGDEGEVTYASESGAVVRGVSGTSTNDFLQFAIDGQMVEQPGTALYDHARLDFTTTSMGITSQSDNNVGMAERPTQIPGTALYDFVRIDSTTSMGVTPQSGIDVGIAERPTHIPETVRYDPDRASSSTGDRYSSSCTYRGGGTPWTPPPTFPVAMLKRKESTTSRPGYLDILSPSESMFKELYQDVDPPPSYASHTP